jgi:hypothetical protein
VLDGQSDGFVVALDEGYGSQYFAKAAEKCAVNGITLKLIAEPPQIAASQITARSKTGIAAQGLNQQTFAATLEILERRAYLQNGNDEARRQSLKLTTTPVKIFTTQVKCILSAYVPDPMATITDLAGAETAKLIDELPIDARKGSVIYIEVHVRYRLTLENGTPFVDWYRRAFKSVLSTDAANKLQFESIEKNATGLSF